MFRLENIDHGNSDQTRMTVNTWSRTRNFWNKGSIPVQWRHLYFT